MKYQTYFLISCQQCFTKEYFSKRFRLITGFAFSNLTAKEPRYNIVFVYLPVSEPAQDSGNLRYQQSWLQLLQAAPERRALFRTEQTWASETSPAPQRSS